MANAIMNASTDTSKKPLIEVQHLRNYLGKQWVHDDVSFTINKGEIAAIVGGSGSGKTTILQCILMLLKPTSGSVKVFGTDVTHCTIEEAEKIRRRWGVMFQQGALFSSLTLAENVAFPIAIYSRLPKKIREEIALLKINLVGLTKEDAIKYPAELSGGMQKRGAIARAIAMDPELLFLDEPTSGLDPKSANAFDELILRLRNDLNITVVMVTHDIDSLRRTADKVIFLGDGKVLAEGPIEELVKNENPMIQEYFSGERGLRGSVQ